MNQTDRNLGTWIVYCAIYVAWFAVLLFLAISALEAWETRYVIPMLANVTNGAIGIGLFVALSWEIGRSIMVIFYPILKRKLIEQGLEQGRQERDAAWEAWLKRRDEAQANNEPFDEPPPSQQQ